LAEQREGLLGRLQVGLHLVRKQGEERGSMVAATLDPLLDAIAVLAVACVLADACECVAAFLALELAGFRSSRSWERSSSLGAPRRTPRRPPRRSPVR
ncbi:hypothetical protein, partial [Aeromicrobium sp.]|uniref:hypothetical protein n=1 Tax=Aeromicrobium sp. TaxID=1871063 RepID=UPI003D6AB123